MTSTTGVDDTAVLERAVREVEDPELPHVTIDDLGMIETIKADPETRSAVVEIIPTYSGCPATEQIRDDVAAAGQRVGWDVSVTISLHPAWNTERITAQGRRRLHEAGIAPPPAVGASSVTAIACPRCGSMRTRRVAEFGSTACKASYQCVACTEPFDYFKPF